MNQLANIWKAIRGEKHLLGSGNREIWVAMVPLLRLLLGSGASRVRADACDCCWSKCWSFACPAEGWCSACCRFPHRWAWASMETHTKSEEEANGSAFPLYSLKVGLLCGSGRMLWWSGFRKDFSWVCLLEAWRRGRSVASEEACDRSASSFSESKLTSLFFP